jgi:N-acylneuraminate cytidylyltransferase
MTKTSSVKIENAVGFVFARGGSKGLPGKNTRLLSGKPLIAWSIERALEVDRISRIIVSTDSEEIAKIAKQFGAEVPFIRPSQLASDKSPEWDSWRHALEYLQETEGSIPDVMVSLPTVAPLGMPVDIDNCLDEYEKGFSDIVITVTEAHRSPFFNMVKAKPNGTYELVNEASLRVDRRQDAPLVYDMSTVCYVANSNFVLRCNSLFEGRVGAVHIPIERAIDIDSQLDFQIAELLLNLREQNK